MTQQTNQLFKIGDRVWVKTLKTEARMYVYLDNDSAKVEVKLGYDKDTKIRQTKLETVKISSLSPYNPNRAKGKSRKPLQIKIKYLDETQTRISKIEKGDWIDLRAAEDITLTKDEFKLIPLGIAMELPEGFEAHVVPRSSTFKNFGIVETNSMGIIDESYKGDNDFWFFPAYALRDTEIKKGERICQFRIMKKMPKVELIEVETLGNPDRQGHGSTGVK